MVDSRKLDFFRAIIAIGAAPSIPLIEGVTDIQYHTSESIFNLTTLPTDMLILSEEPLGLALSQGFARLGTNVSIVTPADLVEDENASELLTDKLETDGVQIFTNSVIEKFERCNDLIIAQIRQQNKPAVSIKVNQVLLAVGRNAEVEGLELDVAGVKVSDTGIQVDANLCTDNP